MVIPMVKVDDVLKTIDSNENFSSEFKEDMKYLLVLLTQKIPRLDLETLNSKLVDLKIKATDNQYMTKMPTKYVESENTIYINLSESSKDYDYRYLLTRELLLLQTYKDDVTKPRYDNFTPIYEGYASICANNLIGNEGSLNSYEDEEITVNLLGRIVGLESLEELFYNNNQNLLLDNLNKAGVKKDQFRKLLELMNYNLSARNNERGKSMLSSIQRELINMFVNKNLTKEEIENFRENLYGNNTVFGNKNKYEGVTPVIYATFDNATINNLDTKKTKTM